MRRSERGNKNRGYFQRRLVAAFRTTGLLLLAALALACLPLTVPRLFGFHIYAVISGSMEPAVPTGSLIYIREAEPADTQEGDVIAFYGANDSASIITHRVIENRVVMGEFITKGDANPAEDMEPVSYDRYIGRMIYSVPGIGTAAEFITSLRGRTAAALMIAAAVLLQILASLLDRRAESV